MSTDILSESFVRCDFFPGDGPTHHRVDPSSRKSHNARVHAADRQALRTRRRRWLGDVRRPLRYLFPMALPPLPSHAQPAATPKRSRRQHLDARRWGCLRHPQEGNSAQCRQTSSPGPRQLEIRLTSENRTAGITVPCFPKPQRKHQHQQL